MEKVRGFRMRWGRKKDKELIRVEDELEELEGRVSEAEAKISALQEIVFVTGVSKVGESKRTMARSGMDNPSGNGSNK